MAGFLREALWADAPGGVSQPAFEQVKLYDALDFPSAMEDLTVQKGRVALVFAGDERWETMNTTNPELTPVQRRRTSVTVAVSDRVVGDRTAAIWGDDTHPGCRLLADIAAAACRGPLFNAEPWAAGYQTTTTRHDISADEHMPGRAALAVEFEVYTKWL